MSHFSRVKTVIRDQVLLQDTLRQLHHRFQAGEQVTIRGFMGNTEHAQVVVDTGSQYDIGFQRQADESFAVCADWWGVRTNTALQEERFLQQVNQTYAHLAVKQQVLASGYIIKEEVHLPNGEIELVVCEPY